MNELVTTVTDYFASFSLVQVLGIVLVIVFLLKKLLKWAIIFAILMFFVLPYLDAQGYLDQIKSLIN
ncbi:hypothetical protein GM51_12595 [freshwater metagenome]|jgi:hypothetical protein|uniref:Uncharacterized protein n=1 Tax=freshwater metagenome TaxID=449393 RepID=A0A094PXA7_9ZZZZ|nr:hypothetical protein [Candidatus Nanopelagicales bacterium]